MRLGWLLVASALLSGCVVWDSQVARAAAGGVMSKPVVRASISRHREWVIIWGSSETWHLDVHFDDRRFRASALEAASEVRISPDRKAVAVRTTRTGEWQRYVPGDGEDSPGIGALVAEGEPAADLAWPADHLEPVVDLSWLLWPLSALLGLGAGLAWLRRYRKRPAAKA